MRLKQEFEQSGVSVFIGDISKLSDGQKELLKQRLSSISADSKQNNDLDDLASNIKGEIVANLSADILV